MSWSLYVMPLHETTADGGLEWAASLDTTRGLPDEVPPARPLPTVLEVLTALRDADVHGTPWFAVEGAAPALDECPDPGRCTGLDLGEVSLSVVGKESLDIPVRTGDRVDCVSFRKPSGPGSLAAVHALTALAGPQFVYDANDVFVAWPHESKEDLAAEWPW